MELFWKAASAALIAAVLGLAVGKREKDLAVLLSMAACCVLGTILFHYLEPVLDLARELESAASMDNGILDILLKIAGIALVTQLAERICIDAGNSSLGAMLQMVGTGVILYLSIPIFQIFLRMIRQILGEL